MEEFEKTPDMKILRMLILLNFSYSNVSRIYILIIPKFNYQLITTEPSNSALLVPISFKVFVWFEPLFFDPPPAPA